MTNYRAHASGGLAVSGPVQTIWRPCITLIKIDTTANTRRMWINPPIVYDVTIPSNHITIKTTAIVCNTAFFSPLLECGVIENKSGQNCTQQEVFSVHLALDDFHRHVQFGTATSGRTHETVVCQASSTLISGCEWKPARSVRAIARNLR